MSWLTHIYSWMSHVILIHEWMCVTQLIHMHDSTHSSVWRDSSISAAWSCRWGATHECAWHNSSICVCDMTQPSVWRDPWMCVTQLIRMSDTTQSSVWRDSFISAAWSCRWEMTHECVWHNSFVYLWHDSFMRCAVTHWYVSWVIWHMSHLIYVMSHLTSAMFSNDSWHISVYSQSHLGCHFRKLKAQSLNVSFSTFQWKETFEL